MHELHLTRGCQLAFRDNLTNTSTTIKHVQNECFTWRHLRSVLDRHRITLNSHIFCAMNELEHISISRFQKLKTVCNGMLRAHNFYGVAAPGTDFLIRSISHTGHTVFADKPDLGEVFTYVRGRVRREGHRSVPLEHSTGCSDRRTCLNSINASSHDSDSFLRVRFLLDFAPISAKS